MNYPSAFIQVKKRRSKDRDGRTVFLWPAICWIAVICSLQATMAEVTRDLKVRKQRDSQIEQLAVRQKRYVLVIGVDRYDDAQITPLVGASNDARALRDVLIKRAEFPADQIILLTLARDFSKWLEVDVPKALEHRFGLPVAVLTATA